MNIYISLIITMVFSAFFSGMEIAFVSVDKLRFEMERKGGITSRIYGAQNETYIEGWEKNISNLLIYKRLCKI